jgi:hypothetical protein
MILVIVGSRSFHGCSISVIKRAVAAAAQHWGLGPETPIDEVVSGGAKGIDLLAELWAKAQKIPVKRFDADWDGLGKRAGIVRNCAMIDYAAASPKAGVVAIWDNTSRGTRHAISYAREKGLLVFVGHPKETS